jgi:8-hydroxy-5-deazaflavin:NADPH oxidoreductase
MSAPVAIIGAGNIGGTLARRLRLAGRDVTIGVQNVTKAATRELAEEIGADLATAAEAVAEAEIVILAIPGGSVPDLAASVGTGLDGKLIIDATNAVGGATLNGSAHILAMAPGAHYVRAFNTLGWENFADPVIAGEQLDLLWCGPDGDQQDLVEAVVADVGLRPVRVGGVEQLAIVDGIARLWFALVFGQGLGRRLGIQILTPSARTP